MCGRKPFSPARSRARRARFATCSPPRPAFYLSHFFKRHRTEYYERLQAVRDSGDREGWLAFFLRGVAKVGAEAAAAARRILELREAHRAAVTVRLGRAAGNGHRILDLLYREPVVTVARVREAIGASYPAANDLVARLAALGIVAEITGWRRNRVFEYRDYVRVFAEDADNMPHVGEPGEIV